MRWSEQYVESQKMSTGSEHCKEDEEDYAAQKKEEGKMREMWNWESPLHLALRHKLTYIVESTVRKYTKERIINRTRHSLTS